MMPLARSKAKRFRQRRIPVELARPFNRAAPFVAIRPGRRSRESSSIEKSEGRTAADSQVRTSDLIGTQRKTGASAVIGCRAAQICRNGRSGLPRHNILQAPVAQHFFGPAMRRQAMVFTERKFVQIQETQLVPHVERRKPALCGEVAVLLHYDAGAAADAAGVVQRFRESVKRLK